MTEKIGVPAGAEIMVGAPAKPMPRKLPRPLRSWLPRSTGSRKPTCPSVMFPTRWSGPGKFSFWQSRRGQISKRRWNTSARDYTVSFRKSNRLTFGPCSQRTRCSMRSARRAVKFTGGVIPRPLSSPGGSSGRRRVGPALEKRSLIETKLVAESLERRDHVAVADIEQEDRQLYVDTRLRDPLAIVGQGQAS